MSRIDESRLSSCLVPLLGRLGCRHGNRTRTQGKQTQTHRR